MIRYRCSVCGEISAHPVDDDWPVCNFADDCGLLFDSERVAIKPAAPVARKLSFNLIGSGYVEGDERSYEVIHRGVTLGVVERSWLVAAKEGGEPPLGWAYRSADSKLSGEGPSRAAAVLAAYEEPMNDESKGPPA